MAFSGKQTKLFQELLPPQNVPVGVRIRLESEVVKLRAERGNPEAATQWVWTPVISGGVEFIPIENVDATSLAEQISAILSFKGNAATDKDSRPAEVIVTADTRSNRLIVVGEADVVEMVQGLVAKLDISLGHTTEVYTPHIGFVLAIPIAFARSHGVCGLLDPAAGPILVVSDLSGLPACDTVIRILRTPFTIAFAVAEAIREALNAAYEQLGGQASQTLASIDGQRLESDGTSSVVREDLLDSGEREPVVKLVNSLLFEAVTSQASDVHIQPDEQQVLVRYRIDGILHDVHSIPKKLQNEVLSRIKVIGQMNIAEKRLSQDGRATVEVGNRSIDLRLASMPTNHGERIVIRLLEKDSRIATLSQLGMSDDHVTRLRQLIQYVHGMILVTGPTGSGKSTTLYSALRELNTRDRNVVTLEDPIEYQLPGISQTQINVKKGMTFASGLRSILRQDPDVIMVGEIRDEETAMMAIQSALTGHLVFSTLHNNDAASAVTPLMDLGIEPYLVASSLLGVLAQRLVRKNCPHCTNPYTPSPEELRSVGLTDSSTGHFAKGQGCDHCRHIGFRGRFAISELLIANEAIRDQIHARSNVSQILRTATQHGLRLMRDDGLEKASQGLTTLAEVARVTVSIG